MAFIDILILCAIGVPLAFVWFSLVRASVRGGCGTSACHTIRPDADVDQHEPKAG